MLLTVLAYSQSWAPIGAKWTYGVGHSFSFEKSFTTWEVVGDTIVDGEQCSIIERTGDFVY